MRKEEVELNQLISMREGSSKRYCYTKDGAIGRIIEKTGHMGDSQVRVRFFTNTLTKMGARANKADTHDFDVDLDMIEEYEGDCVTCHDIALCWECDAGTEGWIPEDGLVKTDRASNEPSVCNISNGTAEQGAENMNDEKQKEIMKTLKIESVGSRNGMLILKDGRVGNIAEESIGIDLNDEDKKLILKKMPKIFKDRHFKVTSENINVKTFFFEEYKPKKNRNADEDY